MKNLIVIVFLRGGIASIEHFAPRPKKKPYLGRGSWDLVTRAISKATILISTYNPK